MRGLRRRGGAGATQPEPVTDDVPAEAEDGRTAAESAESADDEPGDEPGDEETVRLSVAAVRAAVASPHPPADVEEPEPGPEPEPEPEPEPVPVPVPVRRSGSAAILPGSSSGATATPAGDERSVRLARRRFVRRRWARRWLAWRRILVPVLVLALVVTGVWLVFFSSVLAVSGVQVVGTRLLSPAVVRTAAAVPTGKPLATADLDAISGRVRRLPAVKSVDVSRAWPDRVRVDVTERVAVAVVQPSQAGGRLRGMDASGVLFRDYARRPAALPVIRRTATTDTDALAEAATVAGSLPPALARRVATVSVATVDRISLDLRSGRTVLWGSSADSADKAQVLTALLRQRATAYDVSVPGQPVITP